MLGAGTRSRPRTATTWWASRPRSFANDGTPRGLVTGVFPAKTQLKVVDFDDQTVGAGVVRTLQRAEGHRRASRAQHELGPLGELRPRLSRRGQRLAVRGPRRRASTSACCTPPRRATRRARPSCSASGTPPRCDRPRRPGRHRRAASAEHADHREPRRLRRARVRAGLPRPRARTPAATSRRSARTVFSHIKRREGSSALVPAGTGRPDRHLAGVAPGRRARRVRVVDRARPTPAQIASLLVATARPPLDAAAGGCLPGHSARRLDAYAAVLSLDQAATVTPAGAPVRLAILDRNDTDGFDDGRSRPPTPRRSPPAARAGATGAGPTSTATASPAWAPDPTPFDLDPSDSTRAGRPSFGPVRTQTIEGSAVSFNESQVSDLEVLCYYAYSALYTAADPGQRAALLTTDLKGCGHPSPSLRRARRSTPAPRCSSARRSGDATDGTVAWAASGGSISASRALHRPEHAGHLRRWRPPT